MSAYGNVRDVFGARSGQPPTPRSQSYARRDAIPTPRAGLRGLVCGGRDGVPVGVAADRHFISKCHLGICYYRTLARAQTPASRPGGTGMPAAARRPAPRRGRSADGAADPRRTRGTYGTSVLQNNALTRGVYGPVLRDAMRPPRAGRGSAHKG